MKHGIRSWMVQSGQRLLISWASWISFLDVRLEWDPITFKITSKLYVKKIVLDLAIGVDTAASDTDTRQMSMVFASETPGFYFACGECHQGRIISPVIRGLAGAG